MAGLLLDMMVGWMRRGVLGRERGKKQHENSAGAPEGSQKVNNLATYDRIGVHAQGVQSEDDKEAAFLIGVQGNCGPSAGRELTGWSKGCKEREGLSMVL
ncbi:MAG TPA: hypothetical protein VF889_07325 [Bacteroidota bacterium]